MTGTKGYLEGSQTGWGWTEGWVERDIKTEKDIEEIRQISPFEQTRSDKGIKIDPWLRGKN